MHVTISLELLMKWRTSLNKIYDTSPLYVQMNMKNIKFICAFKNKYMKHSECFYVSNSTAN